MNNKLEVIGIDHKKKEASKEKSKKIGRAS